VLTRVSGRASPMPNDETLAKFGATGSTLAIHLGHSRPGSGGQRVDPALRRGMPCCDRRQGELAGRADPSRHACRYRGQGCAEPIERTAIIFVGPSLSASDFRESSLYDPTYQRRFRGRE
jgi:precorrin-4/cobalt-precorrin-4 C11-methyltransferase